MTRFFFDIRSGQDLYPDEQGLELPDQRSAEIEAAQSLIGLAKERRPLDARENVAIEVRTESGSVFKAAFIFAFAGVKH